MLVALMEFLEELDLMDVQPYKFMLRQVLCTMDLVLVLQITVLLLVRLVYQ